MPFEIVIPAQVANTAATDTINLTEFFEIPFYWNIQNGDLYTSLTNRQPVTSWSAKRGDNPRIALRPIRPEADGVINRITFPSDVHVYAAAVAYRDFGGTVLTDVELILDETDPDDPVYKGVLSLKTDPINDAIDFGEATEKPTLSMSLDFEAEEWDVNGDPVAAISSDTITVVVNNDVRRRDAQAPTLGSGLRYGYQLRGEIDGLVTGTNPLNALATVNVPVNRCMVGTIIDFKRKDWLLVADPDPGVTVPDNIDIVAPADYHAATNAKLWLRLA